MLCRAEDGHRPVISGRTLLVGTTVGGDVEFSGAAIGGGLSLKTSEIRGTFLCCPCDVDRSTMILPIKIRNQLRITMTHVKGDIDLRGVTIIGRLHLQTITVNGFVMCQPRGSFRTGIGQVLVEKATLQGNLDLSGVKIEKGLAVIDSSVQGAFAARSHPARIRRRSGTPNSSAT